MPRKPLGIILGALFGVLALTDWAQVLLFVIGRSENPAALIALHAVAYGALATALLVALPSLLELPADAG